jgi:hypothetical protein
MSSVGLTNSSPSLLSFLQNLSTGASTAATSTLASATTAATSALDPTTPTTATSTTDPTSALSQAVSATHHHHHHGHGGGQAGGLFSQIQSAVTNALNSAQSNGSTEDPNQIVQDAIAKVLQQNGLQAPDSDGDTGSDTSGSVPTAATGSASDPQQTFFNTLKGYGIDPQQFNQDFIAAIKSAQSGQGADPASALASFPPGLSLDTEG